MRRGVPRLFLFRACQRGEAGDSMASFGSTRISLSLNCGISRGYLDTTHSQKKCWQGSCAVRHLSY